MKRIGLGVAGILMVGGCQSPMDNLDTILMRHQHAAANPHENGRASSSPDGAGLTTGQAEGLLPPGLLTLESARSIAVRANPDIHAAQARLEAALARVGEAQSRYFPTATFSHSAARTFHTPASRNRLNTLLLSSQPVPTDVDLGGGDPVLTTLLNALRRPFFNTSDDQGNRNSFSEHSTALTFSWTAFDGFIREAQILGAKYVYRAASYSLADAERLITHALDTAYYQVQLAEEQLRIARADEQFSREQYEETQTLQAAGRATQADVGNFRVRMLAAQANVTGATGVRDTGRVVLAELMGLGAGVLAEDTVLSPLTEETTEEISVPGAEPWLEKAMRNRPDVEQLSAVVESERENTRAVRGLFSPSLLLSGSWGFDRSSTIRYTVEDQSSAAAVELRWELYSGGSREARLRAAEAAATEAQAALHRLKLSVQSQVRTAIIDLSVAQGQIRLRRESLESARENRRAIQAGYLGGKETLTRLNEAQRDFIEADANLALARIRLRQAWTDLYSAAAAYGGDEDGSGDSPP